jgi:hypothetical protein
MPTDRHTEETVLLQVKEQGTEQRTEKSSVPDTFTTIGSDECQLFNKDAKL